jgi:hypothetical protein
MYQQFSFALLSCFRQQNVPRSSRTVTVVFVRYSKYGVSQQIVIKVTSIKFQENPSSGSSANKHGQREGRAYLTKLVGAFHDLCKRALSLSSHFTGNTIFFSVTKSSSFILCREMVRVSCENRRKHVHKPCVKT